MRSNNRLQATAHKLLPGRGFGSLRSYFYIVGRGLNRDVRHKEMKISYIIAVLVAILAPCVWATSLFHIHITTNAEPTTYSIVDRPVSRQELSKSLTLTSKIDAKQTIILEPAPLASTRLLMDIVSELKALGLTNVVVYYRELPSPLAYPRFTLSFPLNLDVINIENGPDDKVVTLPAEEAQEIERLYRDAQQKRAEQSGPAYPPQGVGSADP